MNEIKEETGTPYPLEHYLLHSPSLTPKLMLRNSTVPCKWISDTISRTGFTISSDGGSHAGWSQHFFGTSTNEQGNIPITLILFVNRY